MVYGKSSSTQYCNLCLIHFPTIKYMCIQDSKYVLGNHPDKSYCSHTYYTQYGYTIIQKYPICSQTFNRKCHVSKCYLSSDVYYGSFCPPLVDDPHLCPSLCHLGECPPCDKTSTIHCLCGWSTTSVSCVEVVGGIGAEFRCGRVCNKKKSCGRHRCNTRCCVVRVHMSCLLCFVTGTCECFLFQKNSNQS